MSKIDLPVDITIKSESNGKRYVFPKRNLRKMRGIGIGILIFGLFITGFMFFWMYGPLSSFLEEDGGVRWFLLVFGLLGTPGLLIGLAMVTGGIAVIANNTHSEIIIRHDTIHSVECFGFLKWSRKRETSKIKDLVIGTDVMTVTNGNSNKQSYPLGEDAACLRLQMDSDKSMMMIAGYPKETVTMFANFLAEDIIPGKNGVFSMNRKIEIREESYEDDEYSDDEIIIEPPSDTTIIYQKLDQGCTLTIPPIGIWKGSKGLMFFSCLWNGFMTFFTLAFIKSSDAEPAVFLFIGFFWLIGISLLLGAINMGKRKALIAVVGNTLGIRRTSIFKTKELKIPTSEITSVIMGPSGTEVNDVPVMELQVFTDNKKKKKAGLLSQLTNDELEWIAYLLRQELKITKS